MSMSLQTEAQETRLQRTEEDVKELTASVAVSSSRLERIEQAVSYGFAQVNQKIEESVAPLAAKLHAHVEQDMVVSGRVTELERAQATREKHAAVLKKLLWPIATMAAGALGERVLHWLHLVK
jgi:hypothetical protein